MLDLNTNIQFLTGVGPKMGEKLERLGICTIRDLLFYFPRKWDDFTNPQKISKIRIGEEVIIKGKITELKESRTHRKWMSIIEAAVEDETGVVKAIWFNQSYLKNLLKINDEWLLAGKVNWDFKNSCKTLSVSQMEQDPIILPVYPETEGLTSKFLRKILKPIIKNVNTMITEYLPQDIIAAEDLIDLGKAISDIHFPKNFKDIESAKKRLGFDELFLIALRMLETKKELQQEAAPKMKIDERLLKEFVNNLPYKLTNAQRKAAWEIIQDLTKPVPMNRLLEGDVGSGKTVVAAMAALVASSNKYQTVWLAPTEILAQQHYSTANKLFGDTDIRIGLVTSGQQKLNHESRIKNNAKMHDSEFIIHNSDLLFGTHALIQKDIQIPNLGLVIVDEQHRFGVKQRSFLRNNRTTEQSNNIIPHLLSMTATPIPRTLALALYGDLDISIIDEMPVGRKKVETYAINPKDRAKAYDFIASQIRVGRQAFVICPLIEAKESNKINLFETDRKSVMEEYNKLSKKIFPDLKIGLLHGRLKAKEKDEVMAKFKNRQIDILVSTAVVEVGIDIPNATVMMIESAERFGLAQLHQFRGRVGRGEHQSYCFLFAESWSENTKKRLSAMTSCFNGFELAERDLEIRGPGEMVGLHQSGEADLKMASLTDTILIAAARKAAERIMTKGIEKYPDLQKKLAEYESARHLE